MPKVKWLGGPKLDDLILGRAAKNGVRDYELAEMVGESKSTFCDHKKNLLDRLTYNQVMQLCKGLGLTVDEFAATLRLPQTDEELATLMRRPEPRRRAG